MTKKKEKETDCVGHWKSIGPRLRNAFQRIMRLSPTTHFLIGVCTEQFVQLVPTCFFSGSSCLALVSEPAVAMQVVVSERLS